MKTMIYIIKEEKYPIFIKYPELKPFLLKLKEKNNFYSQQISILLEETKDIHNCFIQNLSKRKDYQRKNNQHIIENKLTKATHICTMHQNYLEIDGGTTSNIFTEVVKKNFPNNIIITLKDE